MSTRAGSPNPTATTSGGGRAHLLDGIEDDVERLLAVGSAPLPAHPVVHHELLVDHPAEQLRATGIDPDHAPWRHAEHPISRHLWDPTIDKIHPNTRSTARAARGSCAASGADLERLRERLRGRGERDPRRPREPGVPGEITPGRVLRWVAIVVAGWVLLSAVLFMLSAQLEEGVSVRGRGGAVGRRELLHRGDDARAWLRPAQGVLDRPESGARPGRHAHAPALAFGSVRKLSIPRDSAAAIPGHGVQKINAAYALGGPALTIETVEQFLGNGLKIHHIVEVDFEDFPELIDALGGVTVNNKTRICSPEFDNFYRGFKLPKGEQELDGRTALGFSRVRKNPCAPGENDLDRAERQQEVLGGIKRKMFSPETFIRLPWVSWKAPKALRSDLKAPGLSGLALDVGSGGVGETDVLKPSCLGCGPGSSLLVSDGEKQAAVDRLLGR